jgi:hypothetical protein
MDHGGRQRIDVPTAFEQALPAFDPAGLDHDPETPSKWCEDYGSGES